MKESIGYTVTLNIAIVFIIIIFGVFAMSISYYRTYKVSNKITYSIEKYEGYNNKSEAEIVKNLSSLGYNMSQIKCKKSVGTCNLVEKGKNDTQYSEGDLGYCVYRCSDNNNYYHYKTITNMVWNIPILNSLINFPVEVNAKQNYNFSLIRYGSVLNMKLFDSNRDSNIDNEYVKIDVNTSASDTVILGTRCALQIKKTGVYEVALCGASGEGAYGGAGACVTGQIIFKKDSEYRIFIGTTRGYNGGGASNVLGPGGMPVYNDQRSLRSGDGGGATDIRTSTNQYPGNEEGLRSRIIVAAGGGGYSYSSELGSQNGMDGLGIEDSNLPQNGLNASFDSGGVSESSICSSCSSGKFGIGGSCLYNQFLYNTYMCTERCHNRNESGGGGGGGYYGGAAGLDPTQIGGGGSSYIGSDFLTDEKKIDIETSTGIIDGTGKNIGAGRVVITLLALEKE